MDMWIVAAAAGAGYMVQLWKNLTKGRQNLPEPSSVSSNFVKPECLSSIEKVFRFAQRRKVSKDVSTERAMVSHGGSMEEMPFNSGFDGVKQLIWGNYEICNILSILNNEDLLMNQDAVRVIDDIEENSGDSLSGESCFGFTRNRSFFRARRTNGQLGRTTVQFMKPLNSLESCLTAQLYNEHVEMDKYLFCSIPSPSRSTLRPCLVSDGNKIIRKRNNYSSRVQGTGEQRLHKETYSGNNDTIFGVTSLPNFRSMESLSQVKMRTEMEQSRSLNTSSTMVNGVHLNSQGSGSGSSHITLLFCLGLSLGIILSSMANRREVDRLNELLKQTENLVQDLEEELEMKVSLTVKELTVEDYESQDTQYDSCNNGATQTFSPQKHKKFHDKKEEKESFSKIEAELEAELKRLELNIQSSSLKAKLSGLVELDPDFVPDTVDGDLQADMFGWQTGDQPYADRDGSSGPTTHTTNYAVSPRELSLRLHEVLQSRLEERVKELESELQNSQRKLQYMGLQRTSASGEFSNNEAGSSSSCGSPTAMDEQCPTDQPVVIDLSAEALDEENEACVEVAKVDELEEEDSSLGVHEDSLLKHLHTSYQNIHWIQNGGVKHDRVISNRNASMAFTYQEGEHCNSSSNDINISIGRDENDDDHDGMERMLIKQIVEKTRRNSPLVIKAQRCLFSRDKNEH